MAKTKVGNSSSNNVANVLTCTVCALQNVPPLDGDPLCGRHRDEYAKLAARPVPESMAIRRYRSREIVSAIQWQVGMTLPNVRVASVEAIAIVDTAIGCFMVAPGDYIIYTDTGPRVLHRARFETLYEPQDSRLTGE